MTTEIHRRVARCRADDYPPLIGRLASGWAVLGDPQVLPGYALIYPDPVVAHLNALDEAARAQLFRDVAALGDVLLQVTGALRINYEILGNLEPALHVHLFPRYADEPVELRTRPVWFHDWEGAVRFDAGVHLTLLGRIRQELVARGLLTAGGP